MNRHLVSLYRHMPTPAKNLFATVRGVQLRRMRYGPETDDLVEAALERDQWSGKQWQPYREERLASMLERAAKHVPYYRDHWDERRRAGDRAAVDVLENWPILEKETLRKNPHAFLADDSDPRTLYHIQTSGTTGTPIQLWWSPRMMREHYALHEARARRWYGVTRHSRYAMIGGQLVVPSEKTQPPFWVHNYAMHQLYMSSYHLSPRYIPLYVTATRQHEAEYILAYTSSVYAIARYILQAGIEPPKLKAIITNAEPIYDFQRATLRQAFGCPVYETYGQTETVAFGSECSEGNLHLWPEVGWIELMDGDRAVEAGSVGDIVATGLLNEAMPLIRYRLGDRASFKADQTSTCEHRLPLWGQIEGRSDDVLFTRDGRSIGRLDPIFKADLPVKEVQIIQKSLDSILIKYVPDTGFAPEHEGYITEQVIKRMGEIQVVFEAVESFPRTKNGKFRAVINEISADELAQIKSEP